MASRFRARSPSSRRAHALAALVAIAMLAGGKPSLPADLERFAIVASPDVPVQDLSLDELRSIFMFRKHHWSPGRPVTVVFGDEFLNSDSALLEMIYGMDYPSLRRMILEKLYQGELDLPPKVVATDRAVIAYVANGRGLLGWVHASALSPQPDGSFKVLTIGGKAYGDPGYPLTGR